MIAENEEYNKNQNAFYNLRNGAAAAANGGITELYVIRLDVTKNEYFQHVEPQPLRTHTKYIQKLVEKKKTEQKTHTQNRSSFRWTASIVILSKRKDNWKRKM